MNAVILDDTDARITYSAGWITLFDAVGARNQTIHRTCTADAWLQLSFYGTSVSVIGTGLRIGSDVRPLVSFTVDGDTAYPSINPSVERDSPQALVYTTPELNPDTEHVLFVQFNGTALDDSTPCYRFDYLAYTSGIIPNQQNLVDPVAGVSPRSGLHIGLILTISAACLLFIEVAIALLLLRWYRKRKRQTHLLRTNIGLSRNSMAAFDDRGIAPDSKVSIRVSDSPPSPGSDRSLEVVPPLTPRQEVLVVPPRRKSRTLHLPRRDLMGHTVLENITEASERDDEGSDALSYMTVGSARKV